MTPASASTPDRSWRGITRLAIITDVRAGLKDAALTDNFCLRIKRVAERNAPLPIECVDFGDAALKAGDAVVLIAQAAVQEMGSARALVFTVRKDKEGGLDPQPVLMGSAPRAVTLTGSAADEGALERALSDSLSEVLPWLRPSDTDDLIPTTLRERKIG